MNFNKERDIFFNNLQQSFTCKLDNILPRSNNIADFIQIHTIINNQLNNFYNLDLNVITTNDNRKWLDDKEVIFIYWHDITNLPDICKITIKSIQKYSNNHTVIILTNDNLQQYLTSDDYAFVELLRQHNCIAHISDYIRLCLLTTYHCIWLDSTILLTRNIDEYIFKNDMFLLKGDIFDKNRSSIHLYIATYNYMRSNYILGGSNIRLYHLVKILYKKYFEKYKKPYSYFFTYDLFDYVLTNDNTCNSLFKQIDKYYNNIEYFLEHLPKTSVNIQKAFKNINNDFYKLTYKNSLKNKKQLINYLLSIQNMI